MKGNWKKWILLTILAIIISIIIIYLITSVADTITCPYKKYESGTVSYVTHTGVTVSQSLGTLSETHKGYGIFHDSTNSYLIALCKTSGKFITSQYYSGTIYQLIDEHIINNGECK